MSTLTKQKAPVSKVLVKPRRTAAITPASGTIFVPGYARDVLKVKEGADLTKPTSAPGKYL